jgi:hypothetical protein
VKASHVVVTYRDGRVIYQSPVVSYDRAVLMASAEVDTVKLEMGLLWPDYEFFPDHWLWINPQNEQQFTEVCIRNLRFQEV